MTCTISYNGEGLSEVISVETKTFEQAAMASAESFHDITRRLIEFSGTLTNATETFEDLKAQLDRLNKPQKPKISERQIWKRMNRRP